MPLLRAVTDLKILFEDRVTRVNAMIRRKEYNTGRLNPVINDRNENTPGCDEVSVKDFRDGRVRINTEILIR